MKYSPNLNDPRVLKRIKHSYGFAKAVMSEEKPTAWASRTIDKNFGQQQNKLSNYIRNRMLICTNDRYSMENGKCKEYILNSEGMKYFSEILHKSYSNELSTVQNGAVTTNFYTALQSHDTLDRKLINEYLVREFGKELKSLDFNYKDKSNRLWHPLQNVRREHKKRIFSDNGLIYDYDIDTAAPTLIKQYAELTGMDEELPALNRYLTHKNEIRSHIANELEVPVSIVKILINSLFSGARIGNNTMFATSKLLGYDTAKITWLKENPYIIQLRKDIKTCWEYIKPHLPKTYIIDKNGNKKQEPLNSKKKWNLYFQLERQVLNQIRTYLELTGNKYFLEHDGFRTQQQVNKEDLQNYIGQTTHFSIRIRENTVVRLKTQPSTSNEVSAISSNNTYQYSDTKESKPLNTLVYYKSEISNENYNKK